MRLLSQLSGAWQLQSAFTCQLGELWERWAGSQVVASNLTAFVGHGIIPRSREIHMLNSGWPWGPRPQTPALLTAEPLRCASLIRISSGRRAAFLASLHRLHADSWKDVIWLGELARAQLPIVAWPQLSQQDGSSPAHRDCPWGCHAVRTSEEPSSRTTPAPPGCASVGRLFYINTQTHALSTAGTTGSPQLISPQLPPTRARARPRPEAPGRARALEIPQTPAAGRPSPPGTCWPLAPRRLPRRPPRCETTAGTAQTRQGGRGRPRPTRAAPSAAPAAPPPPPPPPAPHAGLAVLRSAGRPGPAARAPLPARGEEGVLELPAQQRLHPRRSRPDRPPPGGSAPPAGPTLREVHRGRRCGPPGAPS